MSNGNGIQQYQPQQPQNAGTIQRQEFGAEQSIALAETASAAVAAQATAAVQARYVMAMKRPRDLDMVRFNLLKECARPSFAAVARYRKPVGDGIEGPSIRFAEAAMRAMTNVYTEVATVYDDAMKRIVRVSVTDLEANVTFPKDIVIEKTVERRFLKKGQTAIRQRTNSAGETTYLVQASEDELLNKEAALVSKAMRTGALRLLPGDILDECMAKVIATQRSDAAKDPDAQRKAISDAFGSQGVSPADLKAYLGHELATCSPAEIVQLRELYNAIRDGEATWADALETKHGSKKADEKAPEQPKPASKTAAVKAQLLGSTPADAPEHDGQEPPAEEGVVVAKTASGRTVRTKDE